MRKRAKLFSMGIILVFEITGKSAFSQDTVFTPTVLPPESYNKFIENWDIMWQALEVQFKLLDTDSLNYYMKLLNEQMKNLPEPLEIPDFITSYNRDVSNTTVNLNKESKLKEISVSVDKEIPILSLNIKGRVSSGSVDVEIFDPKKVKQGGFTIVNDDNKNGEMVYGSINKSVNEPLHGIWKIIVSSQNAYGNIYITSIK
jgi:hypothetical protein